MNMLEQLLSPNYVRNSPDDSSLQKALSNSGNAIGNLLGGTVDLLGSMASKSYAQNLVDQNRNRLQQENNLKNQAYVNNVIGNPQVPFSQQFTQTNQVPQQPQSIGPMPQQGPKQSMVIQEPQQATGFQQHQNPSIAASQLLSAPSAITRDAASGILQDLMQPRSALKQKLHYMTQGVQGSPNQRTNAVYDPNTQQTTSIGNPYQQSRGVTVENNLGQAIPKGRMYTPNETKQMGLNTNARWWNDGKGGMPKKIGDYSAAQVKSASSADALMSASRGLNNITQEGYVPDVNDFMNQFGAPAAISNFFRSTKGQRYLANQNNWIDVYLAETSGADVTKAQRENAIATFGYYSFDSPAMIKEKARLREKVEERFRKKSGGAYTSMYGRTPEKKKEVIANPYDSLPPGFKRKTRR